MLLNHLLPPRCLRCHSLVERHSSLCAECWGTLEFITPPWCSSCGAPHPIAMEKEALCASCIKTPPLFDKARAALLYNAESAALITRLKFHDVLIGADTYAQWMRRVGSALLAETDVLVPIPLHARRLITRRYNQAAILARALSKQSGVMMLPTLLLRKRATLAQTGLSRSARLRNVSGAFKINARYSGFIRGKTITLIDDVFTTGATLTSATRTLKRAGAKKVHVLTLARRLI